MKQLINFLVPNKSNFGVLKYIATIAGKNITKLTPKNNFDNILGIFFIYISPSRIWFYRHIFILEFFVTALKV